MKYFLFCALSFLAVSFGIADETVKDTVTGEVFPAQITLEEDGHTYTLLATGISTRKKFGVKVYSVAHYMEQGPLAAGDKFLEILKEGKVKQLTFKWLHNASAKQMQEGYLDSFKNILSKEQHTQLENPIQEYVGFFKEPLKKGDTLILRWLPGGKIELLLNQKELGHLSNPDFAKALWSMWFGPKSVVDRDRLLK